MTTVRSSSATPPAPVLGVLVYSDDREVRTAIRRALGTRPSPELPAVEIHECATPTAAIERMDRGVDLAILDGEAVPAGGIGLCRQLKDEIYNCPPILIVIGRPQDAWLATWSRADAVVPQPIDAMVLADSAAALLRRRLVTS